MIQLSYIIPFYKGEKTIFTMMDSIFAMGISETEFEVIVVDDCSPVTASDVLKELVKQHSNVRIIRHEINKRQGGAKNTGIRAAKGKYIAFADQDDVINPRNLCEALSVAIQNDVDMLACHYSIRRKNGRTQEDGMDRGDGAFMSGKEFCEQYFMSGYNLAPWANLYKREFLMRVAHPYEENVVMEDSDWIAWHWIHANKVGIYNHSIYTWVMNSASITHSFSYINRADWIKFGYRKIRDAKVYMDISPKFAELMIEDGRQNIIGGMKKVWKVDNYQMFYHHLGDTLIELQQMKWSGIVHGLINHPAQSIFVLSIVGPVIKTINYVRRKLMRKV